MMPPDYSLYLVTDRPLCRGRDLIDVILAGVSGGVTIVQLREKHLPAREFVELARAVKAALAKTGVPVIVNDRVDVALASGADGAHVGQEDIDPASVRLMLGPDKILGLSVSTPEEIAAAESAPADYLGLGPVFATTTKPDAKAPVGLGGVSAARNQTKKPLVAIGGIDAGNAASVIGHGAFGLAVVSAICAANDPKAAAAAILAAVRQAREER